MEYQLTDRISIISHSTYRKASVRYITVDFDVLSLNKIEHDVSKVTVINWKCCLAKMKDWEVLRYLFSSVLPCY